MWGGVARLRDRVWALFPERHLYVRSGGEMRAFVLSSRKQMVAAGGMTAAALWMGVCTAGMLMNAIQAASSGREAARDQARLDAAIAELHGGGPAAQLAAAVERRHAALALLLADARTAPGAEQALRPAIAQAAAAPADPMRRVENVRLNQEQIVAATDSFAAARAARLRAALRVAGVAPAAPAGGEGGPLIEVKDAGALAAELQVDPAFAARVQHAASDLAQARALSDEAGRLPLARPTRGATQTSGFGVRADPFNNHAAFHPGLDFAGGRMAPIYATAPGIVSYTGARTGYGQTVEIDHGQGYKTRYAHLASIGVRVGQHVAAGQRIAGMGSTGRSTGTHLHYEVWVNGRVQNPDRFVRAGTYVLQAG